MTSRTMSPESSFEGSTSSDSRLILSLLHQLAYLQGYKAAVFDSQYRFRNPGDISAKVWKQEHRACQEIAGSLAAMLDGRSGPCREQIAQLLEQYLRNKREKFGLDSKEFEGARSIVERVLAFLVDYDRTGVELRNNTQAVRVGPWSAEKQSREKRRAFR